MALAVLVMSGCFGGNEPSGPTVSSTPSPTPSESPTPTASEPPIAVGQINRTIYQRDCWGVQGIAEVPRSQVDSHVPEEFSPIGDAPLAARVFYHIHTCARITVNDTVYEDASLFETSIPVSPNNSSWGANAQGNHFLLETYVDPPEAALAVAEAGYPALGATITIENGTNRDQTWTVEAEEARFTLTYHILGVAPANTHGLYYTWFGDGPYKRQEEDATFVIGDENEPSPMTMTGSSTTRAVLGDSYPFISQSTKNLIATRNLNPGEFA